MSETAASRSHPPVATAASGAALAAFCPTYAAVVDLLSRRWMGLVLRVLLTGPHRFNEIMAAIPGLSDPQLIQRLRELERHGLAVRRVLPSSPVRVEYELTEAGRDLERMVRAIADWAEKWWKEPAEGGEDRAESRPDGHDAPAAQLAPAKTARARRRPVRA
jgi:DNA-binding HxlR family transcriptional regulator